MGELKQLPDGEGRKRKRNNRQVDDGDPSTHLSSSSNRYQRKLKQEDSAATVGEVTFMKQKKHKRKNKHPSCANGTVSPLTSTLESARKEKHDTTIKSATMATQASNVQQKESMETKRAFGTVSGDGKASCDTDNVNVRATFQTSRYKRRKKKRKKTSLNYHVNNDVEGDSASQQPVVHVGVDRVNSNWKQLQATLRKGKVAIRIKEPTESAGKSEVKHGDSVNQRQSELLSPKDANFRVTKVIALDCEMVGAGFDGKRSILGRVSLVNTSGNVVYDKYVKPMEPVTDYRTKISGIRASNLKNGENFAVAQKTVADLLLGRVLVGHSVHHDLKVMYLSHPKKDIRDTSTYPPLRGLSGKKQGLQIIAKNILGVVIQTGGHCSVQDARAAMYIYQHMKHKWEPFVSKKGHG